jgi:hypothetical protein
MGNQTFCNCVSLHPKPEKSIDLEKIIKNVEKRTNLGSMNNSNSLVKKIEIIKTNKQIVFL